MGISPSEDMDMVAQIKGEVRKLCTRNNICEKIAINEEAKRKKEDVKRMIHQPKKQKVLMIGLAENSINISDTAAIFVCNTKIWQTGVGRYCEYIPQLSTLLLIFITVVHSTKYSKI